MNLSVSHHYFPKPEELKTTEEKNSEGPTRKLGLSRALGGFAINSGGGSLPRGIDRTETNSRAGSKGRLKSKRGLFTAWKRDKYFAGMQHWESNG